MDSRDIQSKYIEIDDCFAKFFFFEILIKLFEIPIRNPKLAQATEKSILFDTHVHRTRSQNNGNLRKTCY